MTRVAAIDCGTNSIRLLIADVDGAAVHDVVRELRVVRLGEGVERTGRLGAAALERTRAALHEYVAAIGAHRAQRVRMVATSATRDAANRADFVAMVRAELGTDPEVITGTAEAALSFAGAAGALPAGSAGPLLVCDIGGGSTELVRGRVDDLGGLRSHSMDIGCVRLTERHLRDDPPTASQVAAVEADVRAALDAGPSRCAARLDGAAHRGGRDGHDGRRDRPRTGSLRPDSPARRHDHGRAGGRVCRRCSACRAPSGRRCP